MKVVKAEEMQEIDRITIEEYGFPGEVLMGLAGKAVFDSIVSEYPSSKNVIVFCGPGNNGGDGFVVAYLLKKFGIKTTVHLIGKREKVSKTSFIYLNLCEKSKIKIINSETEFPDHSHLNNYDIIIDSIFGTGFKGAVKGKGKEVIASINKSQTKTVSIDMPSGLSSDGEVPQSEPVRADTTITIGLPKISLYTYPGMEFAGNVLTVDIGFPQELTESEKLTVDLVDESYLNVITPQKESFDVNKSDRGHLLVIGGFDGMEGAIIMTARAALKTGIGYISLLTTEKARSIIAGKIPEMMTMGLKDRSDSVEKNNLANELKEIFSGKKYNAIVIGPGMGRDLLAKELFLQIVNNAKSYGTRRVLIDGDGLFHLAEYCKKNTLPGGIEWVITPHLMEAARILEKDVPYVKENRLLRARECAVKTGAVTLLKGPGTVVTDSKRTLINTSGNPALATAGSGDVLSGIIGSLLLKDVSLLDCAGLGAYIHGRSADRFVVRNTRIAMKATDIIDYIELV